MKLVFPNAAYKEKAMEYIREFHAYGSDINGSGSLDRYLREASYEEWLAKVLRDMDIANIPEGRVPALTYFYVRPEDDRIVGMANLRLALNDFLREEGGHIGYAIRPTEREKHYGTDMLKEALKVYTVLGFREVLITCDKCNIASAKVIQNCGGVLDAEFYSDTFGEVIQRYRVPCQETAL